MSHPTPLTIPAHPHVLNIAHALLSGQQTAQEDVLGLLNIGTNLTTEKRLREAVSAGKPNSAERVQALNDALLAEREKDARHVLKALREQHQRQQDPRSPFRLTPGGRATHGYIVQRQLEDGTYSVLMNDTAAVWALGQTYFTGASLQDIHDEVAALFTAHGIHVA